MVDSAKILLVSLINSTDAVGLKYIHSALLAHGYQSTILFYCSDNEIYAPIITSFIEKEQFDFVGVSVLSRYFAKAARLSTEIRNRSIRKTMIVWGGVHPTIDPESCKPYCDYVCVGEAEKAFPLFIKDPTVPVHGFTRSNQNGYTACEFIKKLDECYFPDHFPNNAYVTDAFSVKSLDKKLFQKHSRYRGTYLSVITSRGCPFNCSYCCNDLLAKVVGRKIRERSPENVMKEIEEQIE
jgi:anaerobic magnesium-protoporphyrin IX monomethyl ester cyclase